MVPVLEEITVFPESDCWFMENNQASPKLNKCLINSNQEGNIRLSQKKEHFPSLGSHFIHPSHSCQVNLLWGKGPIKESHNFTTERGSRGHLILCPCSTGENTEACLTLHSWLIYTTPHNYVLSPITPILSARVAGMTPKPGMETSRRLFFILNWWFPKCRQGELRCKLQRENFPPVTALPLVHKYCM